MIKQLINIICGGLLLFAGGSIAAPPPGTPDVFIDGELMIVHIDYAQSNSEFVYHIKEHGTGEIIELTFERRPPQTLRTGDRINVRGKMVGNKLWVQDIAGSGKPEGAEEPQAFETPVEGAATPRKAIYIVVNMSGSSNPTYFSSADVTTAANRMFYDAYSVDKVYQEGSFNKAAFPGPEAGGGKAIGPVTIAKPANCPYYTIASLADAAASAAPFNEDLSQYKRKIYLVPPSSVSGCTWLAMGQVGSYGSTGAYLAWTTSNDANALIHELGHNEGWHHAATDYDNNEVKDGGTSGEYGDTSDSMGYCCYQRKFGSVHLDQIGWLPPGDIVTVTAGGDYTIAPLGDAGTGFPQVLKIDKDSSTYSYYLSYRQVKNLDINLSATYTGGVNIHNGRTNDNWSYFVKALTDGGSFTDDNNGISISQIGHDAGGVVIQVSIEPLPPPNAPSGLTATAASSSAIDLSWIDNATNETGFKVERSFDGSSGWVQVAQLGSNATSYRNTGLSADTMYYYRVFAYNSSANSDYSNTASAATLPLAPPIAPSNLTASALTKRRIALTWTDNSSNESNFQIERSVNTSTWSLIATTAANATTYTNNGGLTAGKTYYYRVRAINADGASPFSNTASATAKR